MKPIEPMDVSAVIYKSINEAYDDPEARKTTEARRVVAYLSTLTEFTFLKYPLCKTDSWRQTFVKNIETCLRATGK